MEPLQKPYRNPTRELQKVYDTYFRISPPSVGQFKDRSGWGVQKHNHPSSRHFNPGFEFANITFHTETFREQTQAHLPIGLRYGLSRPAPTMSGSDSACRRPPNSPYTAYPIARGSNGFLLPPPSERKGAYKASLHACLGFLKPWNWAAPRIPSGATPSPQPPCIAAETIQDVYAPRLFARVFQPTRYPKAER